LILYSGVRNASLLIIASVDRSQHTYICSNRYRTAYYILGVLLLESAEDLEHIFRMTSDAALHISEHILYFALRTDDISLAVAELADETKIEKRAIFVTDHTVLNNDRIINRKGQKKNRVCVAN
jgi:hypothetical protein